MTYYEIAFILFPSLMDYNTSGQYLDFIKPSWSPEPRVFGTVWSILYTIIAIVIIALIVQVVRKKISWKLLIPFGVNLIVNLIFTWIQFGLKNMELAFADILLVLITIVRCMIAIRKHNKWMSIAYLPYLVWVSIATVLQYQIMMLNR